MLVPETVSFHITKHCNYACKHCYAIFSEIPNHLMTPAEAELTLLKLKIANVKKVTFAGGEPLLYPHLEKIIKYANKIGLITSIVTNGSLLAKQFLVNMKPYLDWIGLSIDSLNPETTIKMGRYNRSIKPNYDKILEMINKFNYKLKINTVVTKDNYQENFNSLINYYKPLRWKVFQVLQVKGQNDKDFNTLKVSKKEFSTFLNNHKQQTHLIPEDNETMLGSYLLIDYLGRFFENTKNKHTYSKSLLTNSVEECYSSININYQNFIKRGGIYKY